MRTAIITALLLAAWPSAASQTGTGLPPYEICREAEGETVSDEAPDDVRAAVLNACLVAMSNGGTDAACDREVIKLQADFRALGDYLCKSAVLIRTQ